MSTMPPSSAQSGPLDALSTGMRVVVRHRLAPSQPAGSAACLTDALGELVAMDDDGVVVRTRRGDERISRSAVVAAKQVPPPPPRRGAPHRPSPSSTGSG